MNNPNAEDNLKPFKKGSDSRRNLSGRPPKLIGSVNAEFEERGIKEANKQDIMSCYLRLIQLDIEEVERISEMKEGMPLLYPVVAKCIINGKGLDVIERMLDRAIGKAEITNNVKVTAEKDIFKAINLDVTTDNSTE